MDSIFIHEKWKKLIYKGIITNYSISSFGRIMNDKTHRFLKQFEQNNGYYGFTISINNKPHSLKTARCVADHFIFNDDPKNKTEVNHKGGTSSKYDNTIFNLEWVKPEDNKLHAKKYNLYIGHPGEKNPNSIYTCEQITYLCKLMEENTLKLDDLIIKTGVDKHTIACIYRGVRWSSISKDYNVRNYSYLPTNPNKKYSIEIIEQACEMIDKGFTNKHIADKLQISLGCVRRLKRGKTFKSISNKYNFYKK